MIPGGSVRPKDFAFIYARGQFHLFYILHDDFLPDSSTELDFGHAVSSNLYDWTQLSPVLHVRPGKWDDGHVWAPSIIEQDGLFYMFYTGVTKIPTFNTQYQRVGVATSTDLVNWTRFDDPVFGGNQVPWAFADSSQWTGCQFRDPFVMVDPANSARWLIYDVATPQVQHTQTIVGVGRNQTELSAWADVKPLWSTDSVRFLGHCESPHVFLRDGRWYLFLTANGGHPIQIEYAVDAVADSNGWAGSWSLYRVLGADPQTDGWYATEHLGVGGHDYFAYVDYIERGITFRDMHWGPTPSFGGMPSFTLSYPSVTAVGAPPEARALALSAVGNGSPRAEFALRVELPGPMRARLDVFDLSGRRLRRVRDGALPGGATLVTWDGRGEAGERLGSGVYFALLSTEVGRRSAKLLVLR
jgi:hypothetical protein